MQASAKIMRVIPVVLLLVTSGCATGLLSTADSDSFNSRISELLGNDDRRETEEDNDFATGTKLKTPLLRDRISVTGNNLIALRGVGLVTGLDGTGGDPPPSYLRKQLLDEMNRMKIPNPGQILASRTTALVMVTAYLPAMVEKGQRFDVRVVLPPNSEATSLKGGTLLETRLAEEQVVAGRGNLRGHTYAIGKGAILTALGSDERSAAMLRRGSIPGGAESLKERNLEILLRNEYRGLRTAKGVENTISKRLHHYNKFGQRVPMAEAKTDMRIELMVHPTYRNNYPRYQQMIRSLAYKETDVARRIRIERLSEELLDPTTSGTAALQLEGIGTDSIDTLKAGLRDDDLECRFHAAVALAYLNDSSGVEVLRDAALNEPAFRVYAIAAMSVLSDARTVMALRELMDKGDLETRYGAVRAMKENHPHDTALGTVSFPDRFILHAVKSTSKPAVHVVRYRSPEVVVFGREQQLRMPAVLNFGSRIRLIGRAGDTEVTVTRYELGKEPTRRTCSPKLVDILTTAAELGARYPDVVQAMVEADDVGALPGALGIDRLPQAGRRFVRQTEEGEVQDRRLGTPSLIPGLFDRVEESKVDEEEESSAFARMFAAVAGEEQSEDEASEDSTGADETPEGEDEVSSEKEEVDIESIRQLNLTEESSGSADSEEDEFVLEKTEFQEPMGARVRRVLTAPFRVFTGDE